MQNLKLTKIALLLLVIFSAGLNLYSQEKKDNREDKNKKVKSIGGEEHDSNIYGVKIGMDVPTALEAVFVNANRKPEQKKPDAMKKEGDGKDIRVLYKNLPKGELQIVFDEGKYVKEIVLIYKSSIQYSDLRLPYRGDVSIALEGERYDDRYTIGYTDSQRLQGIWFRDEKGDSDYKVRIIFTSSNILKNSNLGFQKIIQKSITVTPGDEAKFKKSSGKN
ncbi:MAG: hypothetical protein ABIP06_13980 [Pyrinomonadaceae bacterium]